jgi:hypothetical protein
MGRKPIETIEVGEFVKEQVMAREMADLIFAFFSGLYN